MEEELTLNEASELGGKFEVFEGSSALQDALAAQMTGKGVFYTQVDAEEEVIYVLGHQLTNRTGVYAVRENGNDGR